MLAFTLLETPPGVACQSWPTTPGIFVRPTPAVLGGRGGNIPQWYDGLVVTYQYTVDGRLYFNSKRGSPVAPLDGFPDNAEGRRELKVRYPRGKACTVYYNPNNPAESCIEPRDPGRVGLIVSIGALALLILSLGILFLVTAIRGRFRP
jgi:hypothetical protein